MHTDQKRINTIEFTQKMTRFAGKAPQLTGGVISNRKEGWHIRVDSVEENKAENRELAEIVVDMPGATWVGNIQCFRTIEAIVRNAKNTIQAMEQDAASLEDVVTCKQELTILLDHFVKA